MARKKNSANDLIPFRDQLRELDIHRASPRMMALFSYFSNWPASKYIWNEARKLPPQFSHVYLYVFRAITFSKLQGIFIKNYFVSIIFLTMYREKFEFFQFYVTKVECMKRGPTFLERRNI